MMSANWRVFGPGAVMRSSAICSSNGFGENGSKTGRWKRGHWPSGRIDAFDGIFTLTT